jgi:aspartyl-tRNA(Asn)/glutamyl-tRNA(Gln) amidotransferase subunit A
MDETVARLKARGADVIEVSLPAEFSDVLQHHRVIMAVEASQFHRHRFARHPEDYKTHIRALIEEGLATSADAYANALARQANLKRAMEDVFRRVPVLLTPATPGPAPAADSTGPPAFNSPWSFTGLPTISFPSGQFADGLPLAIQLVGAFGAEASLFGAALWCEQALECKPMTPPQGL